MRILFIVFGFPPIQGSGTIRSRGFAEGLSDCGIELKILCHHPDGMAPDGMVHDGSIRDESWTDLSEWGYVHRFDWGEGLQLGRGARFLCRFLPVISSLISSRRRAQIGSRVLAEARRILEENGADSIYVSVGPAECLEIGAKLKKEFGLPLVVDFRDFWSYAPGVPYRHYLDFMFTRRRERKLLAECDRVVVVSKASIEVFVRHLGVPRERIRFVPNGFNEKDFSEEEKKYKDLPAHVFNIVYAGGYEYSGVKDRRTTWKGKTKSLLRRIGFFYDPLNCNRNARSLESTLKAVATLIEQNPTIKERLQLHVYGKRMEEKDVSAEQFLYPECLKIHPRVSEKKIAAICSQADLLLFTQCHYQLNGKDYCWAIGGKLYTYLRTGTKILACVQSGGQPCEICELLEKSGAGVAVDAFSVKDIADGIESNFRAWEGGAGSYEPRQDFNLYAFERHHQAKLLAEIFSEVVCE